MVTPTPTATPATAATTGFGHSRSASRKSRAGEGALAAPWLRARKSAISYAVFCYKKKPVTRIARIACRLAASRRASAIAEYMQLVSTLRFSGGFMVMRRTPSASATRSSDIAFLPWSSERPPQSLNRTRSAPAERRLTARYERDRRPILRPVRHTSFGKCRSSRTPESRWRRSLRRDRLSERLRRQRHQCFRAARQLGQMCARLREHAFTEELREREFRVELGGAGSRGLPREHRLRYARPHERERGQAEEVQIIGRSGSDVFRVQLRVLNQPLGRLA